MLLWSFVSVVLQRFLCVRDVIAKWENLENAFTGLNAFQFAVCGWNYFNRYCVVSAPHKTIARQLSDFVV